MNREFGQALILMLALFLLSSCKSAIKNPAWQEELSRPIGRFCGESTYEECSSDADCRRGGCSGQICQSSATPGMITTCEWKECYNAKAYGIPCKCVNNKCQWDDRAIKPAQ
jgi:eight-cysteine-cluster-containing protein